MNEQDTVTASVGYNRDPSLEVPAEVGEYDHRPVPNSDTTTWERIFQPREEGQLPYIAVHYTMSCSETEKEGDDDFHITRSVNGYAPASGGVPNFPHADNDSVKHRRKVVARQDVLTGIESREDALSLIVRLMKTASRRVSLPPELDQPHINRYREIEREYATG